MTSTLSRLMFCASMLAFSSAVGAQPDYPTQPVKVVVGFAPGGSTDQVGRIIADGLSARLDQSFVVENRSGASGNIAAGQVARAAPDGYTLLLSAVGLATTAAFNPEILQAHPTRDLAPIASIAFTPNILLVSNSSGFKTLEDVLEAGKKSPGSLSFGHSGYGGGLHLTGEIFSVRSGVKMGQVPYKGVAPMMQDLMAGHINLGWDNLSTALAIVRSGKVQPIAIAAPQRAPELPDVPTFAELGYDNMEFGAWFGLSAPKAISPELAQVIAGHVAAVLDDSKVKERIAALGIQVLKTESASDFASYVESDIERWQTGVRQAKLSPEK